MEDFDSKYNKFLEDSKSALLAWMYYLFAIAVVVVMVFIQLGVFEFKETSSTSLSIPFQSSLRVCSCQTYSTKTNVTKNIKLCENLLYNKGCQPFG